jgi:hypothetical protein
MVYIFFHSSIYHQKRGHVYRVTVDLLDCLRHAKT